MSSMTVEQSSQSSLYWRVWLSIIVLAILIRLITLIFWHEHPSRIGMVYAVGTWIPLMILGSIRGHRLMSYLKDHRYQTWERVTHVPFFGPGGRNSFRTLSWLDSSDGMDDPVLASMKRDARARIRLTFAVFCTYPLLVPLLSI